jgi:hypothetical protein
MHVMVLMHVMVVHVLVTAAVRTCTVTLSQSHTPAMPYIFG